MNPLSRKYETALAAHLRGGATTLKSAAALGQQAVSSGLSTSELAKVHKQALHLAAGKSSRPKGDLEREAKDFLAEATLEIQRIATSAAQTRHLWKEMNETLRKRTSELAHSKRDVEKRVVKRKAAEGTLHYKNERYAKLLKESRSTQERLRQSAHRVLSSVEKERGQISRELHNETAQILLGLSIHLLTLQQQGSRIAKELLSEIGSMQRLVNKSMILLRGGARRRGHEK